MLITLHNDRNTQLKLEIVGSLYEVNGNFEVIIMT